MAAKVNNRLTVYAGKVIRVVKENVTLCNGVSVELDIIRHPGAAAIVPLTEAGNIIMIRQYRHATGGFIWEIPAGTLQGDEPVLECARRELCEETGYCAARWEKIGEITPLPAYSDERIHIFMATGLIPAVQKLDSDEIISVREMRFSEAMTLIRTGKIQDAKTISGLYMAWDIINRDNII